MKFVFIVVVILAVLSFEVEGIANCTAGQFCFPDSLTITKQIQCTAGYICFPNRTASICPEGFYCPNPLSLIRCPSGYYCPPMSARPRECGGLTYCPEGSSRYFFWGGVLFLVLIIGSLLAGVYILKRKAKGMSLLPPIPGVKDSVAAEEKAEDSPNLAVPVFAAEKKVSVVSQEVEADKAQKDADEVAVVGGASFFAEIGLHIYNAVLKEVRNPIPLAIDSFANFLPGLAVAFPFVNEDAYQPPLPLDVAMLCPAIIRDRCVGQAINWFQVVFGGFFVTMIMCFGGAIYGVKTFGKYGAVLRRQLESGASPFAYFVALNLVDLFHIFRISFIFASGFFIMASPRGSFGDWLAMCFLQQFTIFGLGYIISLVVRYDIAPVVLAVVVVGNAVFSGATPSLNTVEDWGPLIALWSISYNRWTAEAHVILQTSGQGWVRNDVALHTVGYNIDRFSFALGMTFIIGIAYRIIAWLLFWRKTRGYLKK